VEVLDDALSVGPRPRLVCGLLGRRGFRRHPRRHPPPQGAAAVASEKSEAALAYEGECKADLARAQALFDDLQRITGAKTVATVLEPLNSLWMVLDRGLNAPVCCAASTPTPPARDRQTCEQDFQQDRDGARLRGRSTTRSSPSRVPGGRRQPALRGRKPARRSRRSRAGRPSGGRCAADRRGSGPGRAPSTGNSRARGRWATRLGSRDSLEVVEESLRPGEVGFALALVGERGLGSSRDATAAAPCGAGAGRGWRRNRGARAGRTQARARTDR